MSGKSGSGKDPTVFLDVGIGARNHRLRFRLFSTDAPRTCENFLQLCTGEAGVSKKTGQQLHYKGCGFHRIIKGFMAQGGDFTRGDGTGGESIYGETFADEPFRRRHDRRGLLSMANAGKNTNGSQFFITFGAAPHLNGKHVVFGEPVRGDVETLRGITALEAVQTTGSANRPRQKVLIFDCGEEVDEGNDEAELKEEERDSSRNLTGLPPPELILLLTGLRLPESLIEMYGLVTSWVVFVVPPTVPQ